MSVYFIQAVNGGPIKIGKAIDVNRRFYQLQSRHPEPLKVLGVVDGYTQEELEFHRQFANVRLHGEWFEPVAELTSYITANTQPFELSPKPPVIIHKRKKREQGLPRGIVKLNFKQQLFNKQARERRKITVSEVAKAGRVSRNGLYHYINGEANPLAILAALCEYFDCQPGDLLVREQ